VIHLIAELIENATVYSPAQTSVIVRGETAARGFVFEVEDRGLGMQRADQERVNQLLVNPDDINLDDLLRDGRIGLYVVSVIARQHGIVVQLQTNIYGGIQAVVVLPQLLIGSPEAVPGTPRPQSLAQVEDRPLSLTQDTTEITRESIRPVPAGPRHGAAVPAVPRQMTTATLQEQHVAPTPSRPPLPRRRSQTHMVPQLRIGPARPDPEPAGEHDAGLMASFMNGVSQAEADAPGPETHGR